jgi:hypothetical protein
LLWLELQLRCGKCEPQAHLELEFEGRANIVQLSNLQSH